MTDKAQPTEVGVQPAQAQPECERCNLSPAEHDPMNWCDNQSFRHDDGSAQLGVTPPAPAAVAAPAAIAPGMKAAADLVQEQADLYIAEHAETDPDTGTVIWHHRDFGFDWHNGLEELAQKLLARAALAAAPAQEHATQLAGQGQDSAEPDAWAAVVFGGKRDGKIYSTCDTKPQCESYIGQVEQSNDSITLVARPVFLGAAPAQAQDLPPIVLDDTWKRSMLDGRALVRDEMGCGDHPAIPVLEEGMKPTQFFEALGIELMGVMAESEMDGDAYDAMVEAVDYNVWQPGAPDGDGWALVAIFDTEDGPAAWWMREAAPAKPTRKARKDARGAVLPGWWPDFIQNVAELPDRNSPEDEPDAMIATADELGTCAVNAIDAARAAQGGRDEQ